MGTLLKTIYSCLRVAEHVSPPSLANELLDKVSGVEGAIRDANWWQALNVASEALAALEREAGAIGQRMMRGTAGPQAENDLRTLSGAFEAINDLTEWLMDYYRLAARLVDAMAMVDAPPNSAAVDEWRALTSRALRMGGE